MEPHDEPQVDETNGPRQRVVAVAAGAAVPPVRYIWTARLTQWRTSPSYTYFLHKNSHPLSRLYVLCVVRKCSTFQYAPKYDSFLLFVVFLLLKGRSAFFDVLFSIFSFRAHWFHRAYSRPSYFLRG